MGLYDTVWVPCPKCGAKYEAQSKGGECILATYELADAPADVLSDVNRHAPFYCENCGKLFTVKIVGVAAIKEMSEDDDSEDDDSDT